MYATGDSWYGEHPEQYKLNVTGNEVGIPFGGRMMLAEKHIIGHWDPNEYFSPNLIGGSIEYDVFIGAECKNA